ncbi:hypothetical protein, partial [Bacillus alveayuensis]|uniref:hypothetical protein n=1 Tax=Aeribacillus alveayuensis TaxID=279215 RepID=UPI001F324BAB
RLFSKRLLLYYTIDFRLSGKRYACYVTLKRDVNRTKVDDRKNIICPTTCFVRLIASRKATKFTKTAFFITTFPNYDIAYANRYSPSIFTLSLGDEFWQYVKILK